MDGLELLKKERAVAIVRATSPSLALSTARAVIEGGMSVVEVTMNTPDALSVIAELAATHKGLVGAGTVLDIRTADDVLATGARLVVSPHTDPALIRHVLDRGGLPVPGALTPTEVLTALKAGAPVVKIFPAACVGGPEYIRLLRGPLDSARLLPTGGVTADNALTYLSAGAFAVGLTGWLFPADAMAVQDWNVVRDRAALLMSKLAAV